MKFFASPLLVLFSVGSVFASGTTLTTPPLNDSSGPVFHERSQIHVSSYEKKEKKGSVLVTTPGKSFNAYGTAGRFLYTGNVPRFSREALELTVSKTALTLRAKGWVSESLMAGYRFQQLYRWKKIYDAFQEPAMSFVKMKDPQALFDRTKDKGLKNWLTIALQYMTNSLALTGVEVYSSGEESATDYKQSLLTAMLRIALSSSSVEIGDGLKLYSDLVSSADARAADASESKELFVKNLGSQFTESHERDGYLGFLTYVYPIAGSTKGAFNLPSEGQIRFGAGGTFMESRPWSDFWDDEFGGLPFMEVVSGVGFHGPITNKSGLDAWYLRRGYVSHGCFRMDASDVMELRALLPTLKGMKGKGVPLSIQSWPDVTDVNGDGKLEAIDVGYYEIPTSVDAKSVNAFLLPNAQKKYWKEHFSYLDGTFINPANGERNSFDLASGTFHNIPKYELAKGRLVKNGYYPEVQILTIPPRATSVVQYRDARTGSYNGAYEDTRGKYPMGYFNNLEWKEPIIVTPAASASVE
ncbi:MAG: L,D-transpeptidase [Cryobacterium sp.]|nr:L,D-transpeptidase [Oligoflexia bacterium]